MYRLRFDVEIRNVATFQFDTLNKSELRFDVEIRNVATEATGIIVPLRCGLM